MATPQNGSAAHHHSSGAGLSNDILLVSIPVPQDEAWVSRIKQSHPGLQVRWYHRQTEEALPPDELVRGATLVCTYKKLDASLLESVRFIQLTSAGADLWIKHPAYQRKEVVFCTANGIHPPQIAEWVAGTYLLMHRHFLDYARHQEEQVWAKSMEYHRKYAVNDSVGKRIGILGYGAIGRQVARLFSALGFEVYAYTRSPRRTPESRKDDSYLVPGIAGDPNGELPTAWFSGSSLEEVNAFLAQDLDVLAICLPLTDATNRLIGAEQLDILGKKKAFISNIARGAIVDQGALVKALEEGKLSGAALDVVDPEPLPKGHPLWTAPNCYITPHVSWATAHYWDRLLHILETNLGRLAKGEDLINVMDRVAHY